MKPTLLEVTIALILLLLCFMFVEVLKAAICAITPTICSFPAIQQCFSLIYLILIILGIGIVVYGVIALLVEWSTRCNP